MGQAGFNRQWAREFEARFNQHRGGHQRGWGGGQWSAWGGPFAGQPFAGRQGGPPPWLAGRFGLAQGQQGRGPRVRRGDVRVAIIDVLATEPMNGYQVIQQIGERSGGAWRPSPGSVYPTIQQLEDEGLVESDEERGRRTLRLTEAGRAYREEHAEEFSSVWAPFAEDTDSEADAPDYTSLKPELGQVMSAVWQIVTSGTDQQRREAIAVLVETRRQLYGILAEGSARPEQDEEPEGGEQ